MFTTTAHIDSTESVAPLAHTDGASTLSVTWLSVPCPGVGQGSVTVTAVPSVKETCTSRACPHTEENEVDSSDSDWMGSEAGNATVTLSPTPFVPLEASKGALRQKGDPPQSGRKGDSDE